MVAGYASGSRGQGRRLVTWLAPEHALSDQVAELRPVKGVVAVVVGSGMFLMLMLIARVSSIWVACLALGRRSGRAAAPVVLGLGVAQALWLGALAWQAVTLVL